MELKKYKHEAPYSYTLGMAPTLELIQYKPDAVDKIYVHPEYTPRDEIYNIFASMLVCHAKLIKKYLTDYP